MTDMQFGSGAASSSTHRLTQTSSTLNRRYVERPSNLAIEEAARNRSAHPAASSAPSRLVNLRVHAADLEKAQATPTSKPVAATPVVPKVIELGGSQSDLSQIVPEEAPIDESVSYLPTLYGQDNSSSTPSTYVANQTNNYYSESTYDSTNNYTDSTYNTNTLPVATSAIDASDTQALAMNIAADYAAANLGASMNNSSTTSASDSIDTIASAASEAIAAIRTASDPGEIADQVISLQTFANNLKTNSTSAEMLELSDTIEKFVKVAMKSSRVKDEIEKRSVPKTALTEDSLKPKVTAKKPVAHKPAAKVIRKTPATTTKCPAAAHAAARKIARPVARTAKAPAKTTARRTPKVSSTIGLDEEQALRKALRSVTNVEEESTTKSNKKRTVRRKGSGKRFALAFFCAIICVGAIVYFVGSSIPDISVKVAAMQTGIEASYPSYVPREFSLSDINSENGKITMTFTGPDKASFSLSEEKSSWDSSTLLRNFVEPTWQTSYITTHEQGITIYISGANAAWVNGGVLYKIEANGNSLTKKQLRNIVVSL